MRYEIRNEALHVTVSGKGAELWALEGPDGTACLWDAEPAVWPWHAPVCFPWCGLLEEGWSHGGRPVAPGRHGLVRDLDHTLAEQAPDREEAPETERAADTAPGTETDREEM